MQTEEEIIEGNKLIAEFMEWNDLDLLFRLYDGSNVQMYVPEMKFHVSWDWLMPVVAKISHMETDPKEMFMGTTLKRHSEFRAVTSIPINPTIKYVWTRIVSFINWYNTQSK